MKRLFIDTNIVIDLLDKREPFYKSAVQLFTLAYHHKLALYVSPITYMLRLLIYYANKGKKGHVFYCRTYVNWSVLLLQMNE